MSRAITPGVAGPSALCVSVTYGGSPLSAPAAVLEEEQGREVQEYILRLIAQQHDMLGVLRLMCLSCLCDGGFKGSVYKQYKHELVQVRGRQGLPPAVWWVTGAARVHADVWLRDAAVIEQPGGAWPPQGQEGQQPVVVRAKVRRCGGALGRRRVPALTSVCELIGAATETCR